MQILAQPCAVRLAPEKLLEPMTDSPFLVGVGHRVAQPVEGLDDPHGRPAGPEQLAGGRGPEVDVEIAEMDRLYEAVARDLGYECVPITRVLG